MAGEGLCGGVVIEGVCVCVCGVCVCVVCVGVRGRVCFCGQRTPLDIYTDFCG